MPVGWMGRKLDSLAGATVGAAGAIAASQWREFLQQYRQRLGGHRDEAEAQLAHLTDLLAQADAGQRQIVADMVAANEARVRSLGEALDALLQAPVALQPLAFLRHLDPLAARATLETFQPALPVDATSLAWAGAGLGLGLVVYELAKGLLWLPVAVVGRLLRRHDGGRDPDWADGRGRSTTGPRERREPKLDS